MRLYLMRHADPNPERDGLTPQGVKEAEALAAGLAAEGVTRLYSSVTVRSLETAEATARRTGLAVQRLPWLLEPHFLRINQGGTDYCLWDTFGETVRGVSPLPGLESWTTHPPFDDPGVRAMWEGFRAQCDVLLASHGYRREEGRYRIVKRSAEKLALFSHNGTVLLLLAHLLELPVSLVWSGFYAWPASMTVVHFEEQSETWAVPRALCVADTSFVRMAGLKPVPRGMGTRPFAQWL